jgi:hypothetical protein
MGGSVPLPGVAHWTNRRNNLLGPVFAGRPTTVQLPTERAAYLLAHLHNNPVRAALVTTASSSPWTSHRAYLGVAAAPPWLDVETGLAVAGFDRSEEGRRGFDAMVRARAGDSHDGSLGELGAATLRRSVRAELDAPLEIATPQVTVDGALSCELRARLGTPMRPRWAGDLREVLARVAVERGLPEGRIRGRERTRELLAARRLILLTTVVFLGRGVGEAGALVGLSAAGASRVLSRRPAAREELADVAQRLAVGLRGAR